MEKINFKDLPDMSTPISADNLNLMQDYVENGINDLKSNIKTHITCLYDEVPAVGNIAILSAPQSSFTTGDKFSNYDFIVIETNSRIWGYIRKHEVIMNCGSPFSGTNVAPNNLFATVAPLYNSSELATIQYYFTNDNTITILYNSHYTSDNHLFISKIYGIKLTN